MKQNIYIEEKAFSPNGPTIKGALPGFEKNTKEGSLPFKKDRIVAIIPPALRIGRGSQHLGRDGPPGRARSPGIHWMQGIPKEALHSIQGENYSNNIYKIKIQLFTIIKISIMKKQILFVAMFTLALIFAGISTSNGQEASPAPALAAAPACITPTPLDATLCAGSPLAPFVGVPYTYEVTVPTPATGDKSYNWFVTTDQIFISTTALVSSVVADVENGTGTGDHILEAGTIPAVPDGFGAYNNVTTGTSKIKISWKYWVHDPETPVFLVIYVKNDDDCVNDNIQVYIIKPIHSFTLDINPILADGTVGGKNATEDGPCASPVSSAIFVAPSTGFPDGQIEVEHGVNYLYYMVTAANFNDSWLPRFQVSGTGIDGTARSRVVTAIDWQYAASSNATAGWKATTAPAIDATNTFYASSGALATPVPVEAADGIFGPSTGECIIVRVTVANNKVETIVEDPITLAVDGIMYDTDTPLAPYATAALGDIHHTGTVDDPCPWTDLFINDRATVNIMPRPNVVDATAPATNDFIPKKLD